MKSERERRLDEIYRNEHADYKGKINGIRTIMINRNDGCCLVALHDLSDLEMERFK
jgi:hypothetical protein